MQQQFIYDKPFVLKTGAVLKNLHLAYHTFGAMNETGSNVVWIFHALTANSNPQEWWPDMVGERKLIDPEKYFIVCANMPGSSYGSSSPLDTDPGTGKPYYSSFPFFTISDMVKAYRLLQEHLGIKKIKIGIGASTGGQQLLEWAVAVPQVFEYIIPIATNALHSAWGKAFNASQRMAIEADATWGQPNENAARRGLEAARSIALLSYRNARAYNKTQTDDDEKLDNYKSDSYQRYQGQKLSARFNAYSYYTLTKSLDTHHVGRGRGGVANALQNITAKTLVVALEEDVLFPPEEQQLLADSIPGAQLAIIRSDYGHDGFLIEIAQLKTLIKDFLKEKG